MPVWRWLGLLTIASLPTLAAFGVFGNVHGETITGDAVLDVRVLWPKRSRLDERGRVEVSVRNRSATPLTNATVELDPAWMAAQEDAAFTPNPDVPWIFDLPTIPPDGTARVSGELRPGYVGRRVGWVRVTGAGHVVELPIRTLVWP